MFNEDFFVRKSTLSATTNHQSSHLETILNETQKADRVNRVTWGNHLNMFSRPYENLFQRGRTWEAVEQEFILVALWRLYVSSICSIQENYLTSIDCVLCIIALTTLRINDSFSQASLYSTGWIGLNWGTELLIHLHHKDFHRRLCAAT